MKNIIFGFIKILGWALTVISFILDRVYIFRKILPFLSKEFFSLNLLRIIWISGFFLILKYLYDRFVSDKRILIKAKKFLRLFDQFIDFISNVYDRRQEPSEDEKKQYSYYSRRLRALFSDIAYSLLEYLGEIHKDKKQAHVRMIWYHVKGCFNSSSLEQHFEIKPSRPPSGYRKDIIEEFIGYLKYKK